MSLNKQSNIIFNLENPIERSVQESFYNKTNRWMTSYEIKSFIQGIFSLGGIIDDFMSFPSSFIDGLFDSDSLSDCVYFPCYIIELRNIVRSKKYIGFSKILGFSLKACQKSLSNYPVLVAVKKENIKQKFHMLKNIAIFDTDILNIDKVDRILVKKRSDSKEFLDVKNIIKEEGCNCDVFSILDVPGIQSNSNKLVKTASQDIKCPICNEPYETKCRCEIGDMSCCNGHHFDRKGNILIAEDYFSHPHIKISVNEYHKMFKKYIVNIPSVNINNEHHNARSVEDAVQKALDKAWRISGNPHKGAEFDVSSYKKSPFWNMIAREASSSVEKTAQSNSDFICGYIVQKPFGNDNTLQNFIVLENGVKEYLIRRSNGPAFEDPEINKLIGHSICCKGILQNNVFIASEIQLQNKDNDPSIKYLARKSLSEMSKFQVGDKVKRKQKGLAFKQISGKINKIEGDIIFIKWDGINELEAFRLSDTVRLHNSIERV